MPEGTNTKAKQYLSSEQLEGYREYHRRVRAKEPQTPATRAANTAYARAARKVRQEAKRATSTYAD